MNSLLDPRITAEMAVLQREAARDSERWQARKASQQEAASSLSPNSDSIADPLIRMGEFYLGVSSQEGKLLYNLARSKRARCIVEFGASYGISTLYLGAAARDSGGRLITTEVHPEKCHATRELIIRSGLDEQVTLFEGDALVTLKSVDEQVDLLFLDGWKGLYLPMLELMLPKLSEGALVAADNVDHTAAAPYVAAIQADSRFVTSIVGDMALSCFAG
ncbi:MAG: class I SAM-dependent methyltransferase [Immundisolibacteraceae bacterium]|nr:class I SAM-dependent methyltransferase [Immundisolibacteraceae bacterium]